jgi:PAS domain S-box-containing protein
MGEKMTQLPTLEELKRVDTSHDLILSLTTDQEIIQFNKESERFTGFLRDEVLHKKLSEVLIPEESSSQWKELMIAIQHDLWIDNFTLPLKTKANQVYMITWTGFLVKDEQGVVKDICIFGKPIQTQPMKQQNLTDVLPEPPQKEPSVQDNSHLRDRLLVTLDKTLPCTPSIPPLQSEPVRQMDTGDVSLRPPSKESVLSKKTPDTVIQPPAVTIEKTISPSPSVLPPVRQAEAQPPQKEALVRHGVKKILFAHDTDTTSHRTSPMASEKASSPARQSPPLPTDVLEKHSEVTSRRMDSLLQSLSDLTQKYDLMIKRVAELENKETHIEKNKTVQPSSQPMQPPRSVTPVPPVKNHPAETKEKKGEAEGNPEAKEYTFFSDPFGFKRQHSELDLKKQRIDLRLKQLESFESRLMKEKDLLHTRVQEFSKWQEKLMTLESEIEKRRQEIMKQENLLLEKRSHPSSFQPLASRKDTKRDVETGLPACDDETLEKIPQSAAIIQRGILKQINTAFLELLGYPPEEIVEKSYFDFIALEGLADVEKYYLERLKGDSISVYRTVFSAKDNRKIPVEVSIKQTIYNGEKAEIAIVTSLNTDEIL